MTTCSWCQGQFPADHIVAHERECSRRAELRAKLASREVPPTERLITACEGLRERLNGIGLLTSLFDDMFAALDAVREERR